MALPLIAKSKFNYEEIERQALDAEDLKDKLLKMRKEAVVPANYGEKQLVLHTFSLEKKERYKINSEARFKIRQAWDAQLAGWDKTAREGSLAPLIEQFEALDRTYQEQERDSLQVIAMMSAFISKVTKAYDLAICFPQKVNDEIKESMGKFESMLNKVLKDFKDIKARIVPPKEEKPDGAP